MYRGYFINLDRNTERRDFMQRHLAERGAAGRYERFAAVDGAAAAASHPTKLGPGYLGVWLSQVAILLAQPTPPPHVHILEDDAILCGGFVDRLEKLLARSGAWDLVYTDVAIAPETRLHLALAQGMSAFAQTGKVQALPLKGLEWAGASSFVVRDRAVRKVADLLGDQWRQGVPSDLYLRQLVDQGKLSACVTVPFLSSLSPLSTASDIRGPQDRARRVMDLYRRGFFIEADTDALLAEMQTLTAGATTAGLAGLFVEATRYALSDRWEPF